MGSRDLEKAPPDFVFLKTVIFEEENCDVQVKVMIFASLMLCRWRRVKCQKEDFLRMSSLQKRLQLFVKKCLHSF